MGIGKLADMALVFFMCLVIARSILSWVNPDPYNAIVRFIYNATEPALYRIRSFIPINFGGFDFSPILIIMVIYFIRIFVINSILRLASNLSV